MASVRAELKRRVVAKVAVAYAIVGWLAVLCLFGTSASRAHHGFAAHYDVATQVRIEGRIHEVRYENTHAVIKVLVVSDDGDEVVWTCETQARSLLVRTGQRCVAK